MKKVAIVTINYNSEEVTKKLLESLKKTYLSGFNIEITVVDNGSEKVFELDSSAAPQNDNIVIRRSEVNTGFAGGCNLGIEKALGSGADYVLLLNNDTTVHPDLVKNLLMVLEKDESIGAVSPKIYFSKGHEFRKDRYQKSDLGKVLWFAGGTIDWENAQSVHLGMDEVDRGQFDKNKKIDFATGCCMLVKREVFDKIGFFDERYFLYYEDADLSKRILKAGFEIYYVPSAIVYHDNAGSSGSGSSLHDYFLTRNQMLFGMKYAPFKTKLALIRQSLKLLASGREYQKKGIRDYYLRKFGSGSYFGKKQNLTKYA